MAQRYLITIRTFFITIGHTLGIFWTYVILGIFYCSLFSIAALIAKMFRRDLLQTHTRPSSTWHSWEHVGKQEDWYHPF